MLSFFRPATIFLIFVFVSTSLPAQEKLKIDSLKAALKLEKDTSTVRALNNLGKEYQNNDLKQSLKFLEQSKQIASETHEYAGLYTALFELVIHIRCLEILVNHFTIMKKQKKCV